MTFKLFNNSKTVTIQDDLIKEYEGSVVPFNAKRAEYLAVTSGLDETDTEDEIIEGIVKGMHEELETYGK